MTDECLGNSATARSMIDIGVGQFDCGSLEGWKTGPAGRIFGEWKQHLSSAGAALNISASNQCA